MKPLALDLCCGLGGWARGLIDAGWDVLGIDSNDFSGQYPGRFLQRDIREFAVSIEDSVEVIVSGVSIKRGSVGLVVASPPCQEFSYRSMPWKRARTLPFPDTSIWEACVRIATELKAPLILENVKGAQKYMGRAAWHFGSYYIWGDVPALWPIPAHRCAVKVAGQKQNEEYRLTEGAKVPGQDWSRFKKTGQVSPHWNMQAVKGKGGSWFGKTGQSGNPRACPVSGHSRSRRKEVSALIAMIPYPLALHIGQTFYPAQEKAS